MGERKRRKEKFFADHPTCCYCGVAPVETEDHMPPRAVFLKRQWPEGFVFPSCDACNASLRNVEQVFAFYVRCLDHDERTYDQDQFKALMQAMKNNHPTLMPNVHLSANEQRRILRELGHTVPEGKFLDEMGMTLMPTGIDDVFHQIGGKLAKALHYHATATIMPSHMRVYTRWFDYMNKDAPTSVEGMKSLFPTLTIGARSNTDIFEQFSYRSAKAIDGELFGFIAQFSRAIYIVGVAVHESRDHFAVEEDWTRAI